MRMMRKIDIVNIAAWYKPYTHGYTMIYNISIAELE